MRIYAFPRDPWCAARSWPMVLGRLERHAPVAVEEVRATRRISGSLCFPFRDPDFAQTDGRARNQPAILHAHAEPPPDYRAGEAALRTWQRYPVLGRSTGLEMLCIPWEGEGGQCPVSGRRAQHVPERFNIEGHRWIGSVADDDLAPDNQRGSLSLNGSSRTNDVCNCVSRGVCLSRTDRVI